MNRDHDDDSAQHQQSAEEAMEQEVAELIAQAAKRPITSDEQAILRFHCGLR